MAVPVARGMMQNRDLAGPQSSQANVCRVFPGGIEEKEVKKFVGGKEVTELKKWKYFQLSDYKYMSYIDVAEAVSELSRAFIDLGITADDVVNIYASTW